ncbi:alpha/beta fold hydrolase [Arthrobacter globiformis]|uniref:alpha/beta fold hydrolase n=1 Tax=Arthrobacter globiformis TaxID=1665 RepID=UPI00345F0E0A
MGRYVQAGDLEIWTEQVGEGPDVLLIGGLGDTVESWQFQLDGLADRYRMTAFDNRGAGRTSMPEGQPTVAAMADDAAAVLRRTNARSGSSSSCWSIRHGLTTAEWSAKSSMTLSHSRTSSPPGTS